METEICTGLGALSHPPQSMILVGANSGAAGWWYKCPYCTVMRCVMGTLTMKGTVTPTP